MKVGHAWGAFGGAMGRAVGVGAVMAGAALVLAGVPADGLTNPARAAEAHEVPSPWAPSARPSTSDAPVVSEPAVTNHEAEEGFRVVIGEAVLRIYDDAAPARHPGHPRTSRR